MQGEKVEFKCQQVTQGLISSNVMQMKKIKIGINGEISVYEVDPKLEDQTGKITLKASFNSILQVIYGRLSLRDPYKLTLILDGPSMRLKAFNEIQEEFCFHDPAELYELIKIIEFIADQRAKKYPKDEQQELIEYKRRGYLFIIEQSTSKKRAGRQMRDLRNHFKLRGISAVNKLNADELQEYDQYYMQDQAKAMT